MSLIIKLIDYSESKNPGMLFIISGISLIILSLICLIGDYNSITMIAQIYMTGILLMGITTLSVGIQIRTEEKVITKNSTMINVITTLNQWTYYIKKQDNNICRFCGSSESLHAHHILPKAEYPDLKLNLNNGITLCSKCHNNAAGIYRKTIKLMKQYKYI